MRNGLLVILLLFWINLASAQQFSCPTPIQKKVIFFGNGINVDLKGANTSLLLLKQAVGTTYNGQKLRYDLAYNKTSGIALDLNQAVMQAGAQWNSQIMGWLNGLGVAPIWFVSWYKQFLLSAHAVTAPEVKEHAEKYRTALLFGQTALVVAHSQGNFYVNEAKKILEGDLTPTQMKGFSIFGVAVPSNNIGGSTGPYYTNHRDIILNVPTALSANWTLHRFDGSSAEDVSQLDAHYFVDTYMSHDYDIRPSLLMGIKGQLAAQTAPAPVCTDTYQRHFASLFAGAYSCSNPVTHQSGIAEVGVNGYLTMLGQTLDASSPDVNVTVRRQIVESLGGASGNETRFVASQQADLHSTINQASGIWGASDEFQAFFLDGGGCFPLNPYAPETLANSVNVGHEVGALMRGAHGFFPPKKMFDNSERIVLGQCETGAYLCRWRSALHRCRDLQSCRQS